MKLALHWQIAIGMLVGAIIGVSLNLLAGTRETVVATQQLPSGVSALTISDSPNHIRLAWTRDDGTTDAAVVDGTRQTPVPLPPLMNLPASILRQPIGSIALAAAPPASWVKQPRRLATCFCGSSRW